MACSRAASSSVSSLSVADALEARRANCNSFTDAANKFPRSPGKIGENISFTRSPQPKQSLSGAILVKTASSSALLVSPRKHISTRKMLAWRERPCSPMWASLKAKYWQSLRLQRASLQKAQAISGGSHANSVSDGTISSLDPTGCCTANNMSALRTAVRFHLFAFLLRRNWPF